MLKFLMLLIALFLGAVTAVAAGPPSAKQKQVCIATTDAGSDAHLLVAVSMHDAVSCAAVDEVLVATTCNPRASLFSARCAAELSIATSSTDVKAESNPVYGRRCTDLPDHAGLPPT